MEDAIEAMPDHGTRRFVIYVRKGVYLENVEIKKKESVVRRVASGEEGDRSRGGEEEGLCGEQQSRMR